MIQEKDNLREEISKILRKWNMPTRQVAITEIRNLIDAQIPKIRQALLKEIEEEDNG